MYKDMSTSLFSYRWSVSLLCYVVFCREKQADRTPKKGCFCYTFKLMNVVRSFNEWTFTASVYVALSMMSSCHGLGWWWRNFGIRRSSWSEILKMFTFSGCIYQLNPSMMLTWFKLNCIRRSEAGGWYKCHESEVPLSLVSPVTSNLSSSLHPTLSAKS